MTELLRVYTKGPTDWAPDTQKFILYDWQTGTHPLAVAVGADAKAVRKCPANRHGRMGIAEVRQWQARGAPLRCVAVVVVTQRGWQWKPYNGQLSWAARDYRPDAKKR